MDNDAIKQYTRMTDARLRRRAIHLLIELCENAKRAVHDLNAGRLPTKLSSLPSDAAGVVAACEALDVLTEVKKLAEA